MTTAAPSTAIATIQPVFTDAERLALAGFLAGYRGLTREAYALDLRQFTGWCQARSLPLFAVRRADIESFARELEAKGSARATVTRRLCTIAGFYKYAVEEELLDHSPAAHVRRPRVDYDSHAVALDRNELGALLVAAGLGIAAEHALISLLALPRSMPGSRCATCMRPPHMLTREPRCGTTGPAAASTGTPPILSPRMSRAPPGNGHQLEQLCLAAADCQAELPLLTIRSVLVGDAPRSQANTNSRSATPSRSVTKVR